MIEKVWGYTIAILLMIACFLCALSEINVFCPLLSILCGYSIKWLTGQIWIPHAIFGAIGVGFFCIVGDRILLFPVYLIFFGLFSAWMTAWTDHRRTETKGLWMTYLSLVLFSVMITLSFFMADALRLNSIGTALILLCVIPVGCVFYGIASYRMTKRLWLPHLIFFVLVLPTLELEARLSFNWRQHFPSVLDVLKTVLSMLLLSLLSSVVTLVIVKIQSKRKSCPQDGSKSE